MVAGFGISGFFCIYNMGPKWKKSKFEKKTFFDVFHLRDRFWTLPDGPLDPLDRYKNPKKNSKFSKFSPQLDP